ncbi:hypothetical protein H8356DRAFT_1407075 [Neocallimastix lanati (nom. inval.)]|uniref:Uncharacterized protein n=1 Tax=Neocallimastix californiae TaxID=1754190 RepID=A0A1Y2DPC3_9FUNG|nr:hypothetical protein H8356DRAFT_1407075 [Neocallimastix sp. JGI-2020a]ORY61142.1 hypothetical protein LY90DRAFT_505706 [Neocallimastix californiae]|eukprot:ORY61142.1 hypothetical protein LY90DRAFT_505706 [Neocallimastix californiae]
MGSNCKYVPIRIKKKKNNNNNIKDSLLDIITMSSDKNTNLNMKIYIIILKYKYGKISDEEDINSNEKLNEVLIPGDISEDIKEEILNKYETNIKEKKGNSIDNYSLVLHNDETKQRINVFTIKMDENTQYDLDEINFY